MLYFLILLALASAECFPSLEDKAFSFTKRDMVCRGGCVYDRYFHSAVCRAAGQNDHNQTVFACEPQYSKQYTDMRLVAPKVVCEPCETGYSVGTCRLEYKLELDTMVAVSTDWLSNLAWMVALALLLLGFRHGPRLIRFLINNI